MENGPRLDAVCSPWSGPPACYAAVRGGILAPGLEVELIGANGGPDPLVRGRRPRGPRAHGDRLRVRAAYARGH